MIFEKKEEQQLILSIIVVTWNNENFIEQALNSCIFEGASNYEVIVVHNASDDRTGSLIQRAIKGKENIFRVIENERNEGLGEARNIGIKHAKGEYFIFLDGDDYFESESLGDLIDTLDEQKPDVLFYDYQRVWDTGWKKRNQLGHLLFEHDASGVEERNKILNIFCIACNKAYRKEFIEDICLRFPVGYYEDVPWTYTALLKASHIYVTPIVLLNYRQRVGSILKSTDERHIVLPERYNDLLEVLKESPDLARKYGDTLYSLARAHLFARPVWPRLPKKVRKEYLNAISNSLVEWRKLLKINTKDNTLSIAKLGLPFAYALGKEIVPLRTKIKKKLRRYLYLTYRKLFCRLPIKTQRVYVESYWGTKFDCNPKALFDYLVSKTQYQVFVGLKKGVSYPPEIKKHVVRIGSVKYWHIVATSKLLVTNTNFRSGVYKRQDSIHLQTHHGTPLKKVGIDVRDNENLRINWKEYARRCRRWDYLLSSNPYSSTVWRRANPFNYKVLETGYPRNDVFFNTEQTEIVQLKKKLGIPFDKKVFLYAPTYRDSDSGWWDKEFLLNAIIEAAGEGSVFLIREHHFTKEFENLTSDVASSLINVSDYPSTNELCLISDVLITDYSSIMFDYACLKRPIILFMYDYERYVEDRGVYFDIREKAPGPIAENLDELLNILENKEYDNPESIQKLSSFNLEFCPWDDGSASEKVLTDILNI